MRPTVTLAMIVRDEEENLPACLATVRDLVDEVVVVDTGSKDRTKEVAAELGCRVFDYVWNDDFSAARNETLRHATGDWIFWMDADDRVDEENRQKLANLFASLGEKDSMYAMHCRSLLPASVRRAWWVTHLRLFPRHPALSWKRRVHESVTPEPGAAEFRPQWTDIVVDHVGYSDPVHRRQKLNRDLRLLQMDFAMRPDDDMTLFYLGWTYSELRNFPNALRFLQRSLRRNPQNHKAFVLAAQAYVGVGRREEALKSCNAGLELFPSDPELLFERGRLLGEMGDLAGAESCLLVLLANQHRPYFEIGTEDGLRGERARFLLALIYQEQGRFAESETHLKAALADNPHYIQAWLGLGQLYLQLGCPGPLAAALEGLAQCPGGTVYSLTMRARVHIAQGELEVAGELLQQAIRESPELTWTRLVYCDLLVARKAPVAEMIRAQQEVLALEPHLSTAQENLAYLQRLQAEERSGAAPAEPAPTDEVPGCGTVVAGM